jgi:hypothetical protein
VKDAWLLERCFDSELTDPVEQTELRAAAKGHADEGENEAYIAEKSTKHWIQVQKYHAPFPRIVMVTPIAGRPLNDGDARHWQVGTRYRGD